MLIQPYHNDETPDVDALNRTDFAKAFVEVVTNSNTPLVIGIYGTWGAGKTTLMEFIDRELSTNNNVRTLWFDPWQHQYDEMPALSLLQTMVKHFKLGKKCQKLLTVIAGALGAAVLKATTTLSINDLIQIGEKYEEERLQVIDKQIHLRENFKKIIRQATDNGKKRVVVFIDDLDRCLPDVVIRTLESLKLFLNLPNCIYFIGADRGAIECSIRHKYGELNIDGTDYLDKIVQLPFIIPPIAREAIGGFIDSLLPQGLTELKEILIAGVGDNPRSVKRFINILSLNHRLAYALLSTEYQPRILLLLLLIQYRSPELYQLIASEPSILRAIQEDSKAEGVSKLRKDYLESDVPLKRVLDMKLVSQDTNLCPYIHLTGIVGIEGEEASAASKYDGAVEGYCVKCKAKKWIKDPQRVTMKNGRDALKGKCPTCGTGMFRILSR